MRNLIFIATLVFCILITSCGWQLRRNLQPGSALESLYVGSELAVHERGPESILHGFDQRLGDLGIESTSARSEAQLGLVILSEQERENVLSLTSDLFEQQTRLSKTIEYQIWRGEELLVSRDEVSTYRDMSEDQSNAAAKNREAELIYREINADLINQILLRLRRLDTSDNADQS